MASLCDREHEKVNVKTCRYSREKPEVSPVSQPVKKESLLSRILSRLAGKSAPQPMPPELDYDGLKAKLSMFYGTTPEDMDRILNNCPDCMKGEKDTVIKYCGCIVMDSECSHGHKWHRSSIKNGPDFELHTEPATVAGGDICCERAMIEKHPSIKTRAFCS